MAHSPGPFTVEELPDTAERELGLTHMICGPCQIPEEQGEPVAVAFTFSADDAILFASVLDLLEQAEVSLAEFRVIADELPPAGWIHRAASLRADALEAAIAKARKATP
jgi:hypothetical protein